MIDYFLLGEPGADFGNPQSNLFQRIGATLLNFILSFQKDYNHVGGVTGDMAVTDTLDVWGGARHRMGRAHQANGR